MKRVVVAIDPGFDGCKMVVNELLINVPFVVEDITDVINQYPINISSKKYIRCEKEGRVYLVGEMARKSLQEADHRVKATSEQDAFYTTGRFATKLFKIGLEAFLGYALYRYAESDENKNNSEVFSLSEMEQWDLHVGVALPHQYMDELWKESVKECLLNNHNYVLYIGSEKISFNFNLNDENCVYNSQAICALINKVTDDKGDMIENQKTIYDYLPALVIDAGYKTVGKFKLSRDGRMDKAESNMDYAMDNINENVASKVREKVPDFKSYMVEERYWSDDAVFYEDGEEYKSFDIKKLRDEESKSMAKKLWDYLLIEHGKLLDIKLILLAGGTGSVFYETIKELGEKRPNLKDKIWLADQGFNGEKCDPVFAIAIGLYKAMINNLS